MTDENNLELTEVMTMLKSLQKQIKQQTKTDTDKKQDNRNVKRIILRYINEEEKELAEQIKTIYTLAIENNKINSLTNAINKLISNLQAQINKQ